MIQSLILRLPPVGRVVEVPVEAEEAAVVVAVGTNWLIGTIVELPNQTLYYGQARIKRQME